MTLPALALARAVVACGRLMAESGEITPTIETTVQAASDFIASQCEATASRYFDAATKSYPFGPGDGCYDIVTGSDHGAPGSGCRSGAGTLLGIGLAIGMAPTLAAVRVALLPWLDGMDERLSVGRSIRRA